MQSLKSNALEPTRSELATLSRGQAIVRVLPIYGLPILTVLLIAFFSFLLPQSFPTRKMSRGTPRVPNRKLRSPTESCLAGDPRTRSRIAGLLRDFASPGQ